jgi:sugar phosphate isomerase/epimerase
MTNIPTPALEKRIGISSWSVHRLLGAPAFFGPETALTAIDPGPEACRGALLQLPAQMAAHDLHVLHLCHFHLRDLSPEYLAKLRAELARNAIELHTLLIDAGDISHPSSGTADLHWIMQWIPVAKALGARNIRAIAGKQPNSPEALAKSRFGLNAIADVAERNGIGVLIENWFDLLPSGAAVEDLLTACEDRVELNIDFGNFKADKYANLRACAESAVCCHAKGEFSAALTLDSVDFAQCLAILREVDFEGPYILIYDDARSSDEWAGIALERHAVLASRA